MRGYKLAHKYILLFFTIIFCVQITNAQQSQKDKKQEKTAETENLIQSKNFVFIAQNAFPAGGRNINLTSVYNVNLSADTIVADLPYFGRAYVAPLNPSDGGIHFTSTRFSYTINKRKKGGWDISILPQDTNDVRQMYLTVSEEGYANLQMNSNNRQSIGFSGYITSKNKSR